VTTQNQYIAFKFALLRLICVLWDHDWGALRYDRPEVAGCWRCAALIHEVENERGLFLKVRLENHAKVWRAYPRRDCQNCEWVFSCAEELQRTHCYKEQIRVDLEDMRESAYA